MKSLILAVLSFATLLADGPSAAAEPRTAADEQGPSVVKPFMRQLKMNYPVVMGDSKIITDYGGIEAIPITFIIDRKVKSYPSVRALRIGRHLKDRFSLFYRDEAVSMDLQLCRKRKASAYTM